MFDIINDILYKRKPDAINDPEQFAAYSPYMVNKWVSFYSPVMSCIVNESANKLWSTLSEKEMHFKFLKTIVPQCSFKKLQYIKKPKEEKKSKKSKLEKTEGEIKADIIKLLAESHGLSTREVKEYVDLGFLEVNISEYEA